MLLNILKLDFFFFFLPQIMLMKRNESSVSVVMGL